MFTFDNFAEISEMSKKNLIVLGKRSARSLYFQVLKLENIKQKIYEIVNHKNWIADIRWWDIEEMDVSDINSINFGEHVGKSKRFTLFCLFKINWNCWIF